MKNKPIRGFEALIGETIKKIDASAINVVHIQCESGKIVSIDAGGETMYGIPIVSVATGYDVK